MLSTAPIAVRVLGLLLPTMVTPMLLMVVGRVCCRLSLSQSDTGNPGVVDGRGPGFKGLGSEAPCAIAAATVHLYLLPPSTWG